MQKWKKYEEKDKKEDEKGEKYGKKKKKYRLKRANSNQNKRFNVEALRSNTPINAIYSCDANFIIKFMFRVHTESSLYVVCPAEVAI